jgi:hypothetical protein
MGRNVANSFLVLSIINYLCKWIRICFGYKLSKYYFLNKINNRMVKRMFLMFVALCLFSVALVAQVTTSSMSGVVYSGTKSEPIIGATIVATHGPSGTRYMAVTNANGRFTIQGMRTGGPYKVQVSYVGYQKMAFSDIYLELGNTYQLDANMKESTTIGEVVVMGLNSKKALTGAGQNFATAKIANTPTVDRNIYDVVKNMPMAQTNKIGGISFAGSNNRYNSFQIDGTVSNDVFGLSSSGTNGGQTGANPISMEAIQEIQVVVSPFDVRQSGFTGGGINAITKQGTNQFHGSVYDFFTNQKLYGRYNAANNYAKEKLDKQHTNTFGANIGGPIIKDKLFFFANVEHIGESYPSRYYPGMTGQDYLTTDMADKVLTAYNKYTGHTDNYGSRDVDQSSTSVLARIDWNINNNNKFAFRYQFNNSSSDVYGAGSSTYYFNNSAYTMKNKTNSFVAELNSHISNSLYNEARASMTFVRDHREVPYQGPCIWIKAAADNNYVAMNLGTEYSSGANKLNQNIYTIEDNLSWYKGNHTVTFGTHNEIFHMENQFVQANNGEWVYNSINDFLSDQSSQFVYKYAVGGYIPKFNAGQFGFYAQDKWDLNRNVTLTLGLRLDMPKVFDKPTSNEAFNEFAQKNNLDAQVGRMPSLKAMFSPRFGFRYYLNESHNTLLRGGTGLFTGRVPFVWLSNAFTNDGIEQKSSTIYSKYDKTTKVTTYAPNISAYANNPLSAATSWQGQDICTVKKDFKYPQVFRTNLAIEQILPYDVKLTVEGLYSKTLNNVYFKNLALTENGKTYFVEGVEASAAPAYSLDKTYNSIIDLQNTSKGYTYSVSAMLEKSFDFGLNTSLSYTFGHSKSVFDGTSSVAYSNWKYNYAYDSNNQALAYSTFDIPNRIVFSIGYTTPKYLNGLLSTDASLIYTGSNGMRYSLTMNEYSDFNGDGQKGNSLLYIPTKDEVAKMSFVDATAKQKDGTYKTIMTADKCRESFENWIEGNNYAKNHRGEYSKRNCCQAPWENRIDLHLAENIFVMKAWGSKLQLTCDIINFANLLNKKWGISYASAYNVTPLNVEKINSTTKTASFSYNTKGTVTRSDIYSRWHMQIGAKIIF